MTRAAPAVTMQEDSDAQDSVAIAPHWRMIPESLVLLFATLGLANLFGFAFVLTMSRLLSLRMFGMLSAFLGVVTFLVSPADALQVASTIQDTDTRNSDESPRAILAWLICTLVIAGVGALLTAGFAVGSVSLSSVFLLVPFLSSLSLVNGVLQARRRFWVLGFSYIANFGTRLIIGVVLVALGVGIAGAETGIMLGMAAGAALGISALGRPAKWRFESSWILRTLRLTGPPMLLIACFALLLSLDLIVLDWRGEPELTGAYYASTFLARLVLTLAAPVTSVLLPAMLRPRVREGPRLFGRALFVYLAIAIVYLTVVVATYPWLPTLLMGNLPFLPWRTVLIHAAAMVTLGVGYLFMYRTLGLGRRPPFVFVLTLPSALCVAYWLLPVATYPWATLSGAVLFLGLMAHSWEDRRVAD
ncbi:MAG: MATE family efflux transporter [Thermoplasmatota archaeon]